MSTPVLEHFSQEDIRALIRHPDPEQRALAAQRICRIVRSAALSDEEREFAHGLIAYMADDAVDMVRRALAVTLQNSPQLPHDIACRLIADIDNIAVPVLANSPVLSDEDIIQVLRSKAAAKVLAVASRPIVSGDLVRAIIRYGDSAAVAEVAANDGALIDSAVAKRILDLYRDNDLIKEAFISRRDLPPTVLEKLVTMVSEEAALLIHTRHNIPINLAVNLADRARERAALDIFTEVLPARETSLLVKQLAREGRLTRSFIIRAAGMGKMDVLKYTLAHLADLSPKKAALMIYDGGPVGLRALCQRAGMHTEDTRLIRAACAIYRDLEISGIHYDETYFQCLMLERFLSLPFELPEEEVDWFLERFSGAGQPSTAKKPCSG